MSIAVKVTCLTGTVYLLRAPHKTLREFYQAVCADGYVGVGEDVEIVVPFHAVGQIEIAPPEMLKQAQTMGSA